MDDHGNSPETATNLPLSGLFYDPVIRNGEIKPKADEDWFRAELTQGQWYWFELTDVHFVGSPKWEIKSGERNIGSNIPQDTVFYQAESTTDHYIRVYHGASPGGRYRVSVGSFDGPNVAVRPRTLQVGRSRLWGRNPVFGQYFSGPIQFFYNTERAPLQIVRGDVVFEKDVIYHRRPRVIEELEVVLDSVDHPLPPVQLYGRLKLRSGFQKWTRTSLTPMPNFRNALRGRFFGGQYITYSFDDVLPSYFDTNEYSSFRPLEEFQKDAFRKAIATWGKFINVQFDERPSGQGHIRVGNLFIDESFKAFERRNLWNRYRTNNQESDIFLSNKLPHMQVLQEGTLGYYNLLQSIGVALGFHSPPTVDALLPDGFRNNLYSILSNNQHPLFGDIYPSTPGLFDILQIQANYDPGRLTEDKTYTFSSSGQWRGSIMAGGGTDVVSAAGHHKRATIRLEASEFSFIGSPVQHYWVNAVDPRNGPKLHTFLETAIGGTRSDRLVGSKENNRLFGGPGKDVLIGRQGNDYLNGGVGHDRYTWMLGDGSDVIYERTGNGKDILQIQSQWGLDDFTEDIRFSKLGNDLVVHLELGDGGPDQGAITIRDMGRRRSQIETLRVLGKDQSVLQNKVSLVSVWTQLLNLGNNQRHAFMTTSVQDRFGVTVESV